MVMNPIDLLINVAGEEVRLVIAALAWYSALWNSRQTVLNDRAGKVFSIIGEIQLLLLCSRVFYSHRVSLFFGPFRWALPSVQNYAY